MRPALDVLREVRGLGLAIRADGGRLVLRPGARVTPTLRERILAHKPDLLAILRGEAEAEEALAPFADLLAMAERGELTRRMLAMGRERVELGPGRASPDPDSTALVDAADVRGSFATPQRATSPLWIGVRQARLDDLGTLQAAMCEAAGSAESP
jgi:hypothetical protein